MLVKAVILRYETSTVSTRVANEIIVHRLRVDSNEHIGTDFPVELPQHLN